MWQSQPGAVGRWPVRLPLLPDALPAWTIAHLAKGICQSHLPTGWRLLPVFLPGRQGGTLFQCWAVLSDTGAGRQTRGSDVGGREKLVVLG